MYAGKDALLVTRVFLSGPPISTWISFATRKSRRRPKAKWEKSNVIRETPPALKPES
jgi:hypothetical protein